MIKFAMLLLTLFTVLGGMILGWLARRFWLGGEWCGSLETHPMPEDASDRGGLATGAIGTLAAGTAAMRYANNDSDAESGQDNARSSLLDSEKTAGRSGVSGANHAGTTSDASGSAGQSDASTGATTSASGATGSQSSGSGVAKDSDTTSANLGGGTTGSSSDTKRDGSDMGTSAQTSSTAPLASGRSDTKTSAPDDRAASQNDKASGADAASFMSDGGASGTSGSAENKDLSAGTGTSGSGSGASASSAAATDKNSFGSNDGTDNKSATTGAVASSSEKTTDTTSRNDASGSTDAGAGTGSSGAASAGVGGAALAGAAAASTTGTSPAGEAPSAELEASRAEVRALRKRLGLSDDAVSDESGMTADQKLAASREEASKLRQDLWSKEQAAENASDQKGADIAEAADTDFGGLSSEESEAERLLASGTIPKGPSNKLDAPTPGYDNDDLTKINGIGKPTQARLNRHGIYYYDQIAGFTGPDIAWADRTLNLEGRVVSDRWIPQAKLLAGDIRQSAPANEGGADGDDSALLVDVPSELSAEEVEAERLLASGEEIAAPASRLEAPRSGKSPDDLTKIKGIGPKINGKLNDQGIYYYDQIAGFSGSDLAWADRELDFKGRAVRDRWVPQAQGLMDAAAASGTGDTEPTVAAPAGLLSKPIEGRDPDDLTAIKGVGHVLQKQLNDKGIYYYEQIADFSDSDQEWANQTLGFPGRVERDNWIPQARDLMNSPSAGGRAARVGALADAGRELDTMSESDEAAEMSAGEAEAMRLIESGEFVADDSNRPAGLLSSASQGAKDDLQRIKGVGPKLEDLLNSLGIYYFGQISDFSSTDIAWVDSKLRFKGRIVRDRWVDQAKRLS